MYNVLPMLHVTVLVLYVPTVYLYNCLHSHREVVEEALPSRGSLQEVVDGALERVLHPFLVLQPAVPAGIVEARV